MIRTRTLLISFFAGLVACSDNSIGPDTETLSIALQGGDGQQGAAGSILALPLQVSVSDAVNNPAEGAVVIFHAATGSGVTLDDTIATTGPDGIALVSARLGSQLGTYNIVNAFIKGSPNDEVVFSATITEPPTLASVTPSNLQAGDTVVLAGTGFNSTSIGNAVFFDGSRALIVTSSLSSITVVVPPCVTPGTVPVHVEVGTASTGTVNVTYGSSAFTVDLAVNDGITVAGAEIASCLRLPANGAQYLVVPQFATDVSGPQAGFSIGNASHPAPDRGRLARLESGSGGFSSGNSQSRFDLSLRAFERTMPTPNLAQVSHPAPLEALTLNSTRDFRVLCSLEVGDSCFKSVTGRLKFIGPNVLVYVDVTAPAGGFTDQELTNFGEVFDETLYPIDIATFGAESDIDNNDHVIMLLTPVVNSLVSAQECSTLGSVLGFFFGFDLASTSGDSNRGEIFYGLVPDPTGLLSCDHPKSQVSALLPGTFIHEFQHMISFNQHVLLRGGNQEADWLNEGLSHLAEEMASRHYEHKFPPPSGRANPASIFPDSALNYIFEQLANSYDFLTDPSTISLTLFQTNSCCEGRGASWLFMRYLGDQFDSTVFRRLVQTDRTSIANVEAATGKSFAATFGDFGIAVYADSLPAVPAGAIPERYQFSSRNLRFLYAALNRSDASQFPSEFPLVPTTLNVDAQSSSAMLPGSSDYYLLQTPGNGSTVSIQFAPQSPATDFDPLLQAQVGIFRIQ
jgi:hypothetical protein